MIQVALAFMEAGYLIMQALRHHHLDPPVIHHRPQHAVFPLEAQQTEVAQQQQPLHGFLFRDVHGVRHLLHGFRPVEPHLLKQVAVFCGKDLIEGFSTLQQWCTRKRV